MNPITIEQIRGRVHDLPSLPALILDLIATLDQADLDIDTLVQKISCDPALVAKTLRLANSSFYGVQSQVNSVGHAITVLGFDSVRSVVVGSAITKMLPSGEAFDARTFWEHSVATALCARSLAAEIGQNAGQAFIGGLLHDVGRLVVACHFPKQYQQVLAYQAEHACSRLDAEAAVLQVDHQQTGRLLAQAWKFSQVIQESIGNHDAPPASCRGDVVAVVHVANVIVHALDLHDDPQEEVPPMQEDAWNSLGLTSAKLQRVFRNTLMNYKEFTALLAG